MFGIGTATLLIFAAAAAAIYLSARISLLAEFDDVTMAKARYISSMTEYRNGHLRVESEIQDLPEFQPGEHAEYFAIWLQNGQEAILSHSLQPGQLHFSTPSMFTIEISAYPEDCDVKLIWVEREKGLG